MRFELRVTAYDALDVIMIRGVCDATLDLPNAPTERVWERTAESRGTGTAEATVWIREVLETMLRGL